MKSSLMVFTAGVLAAVAVSAVKGYGVVPAGLGRTIDAIPAAMVIGGVTPALAQADDVEQIAKRVQAVSPATAAPSADQPPAPSDRSEQAVPSSPVLRPTDRLAQAQSPTTQPTVQAAPPQTPDETALRYFASRGDKARLQAEISRLQALYPNWIPPADPLNIPQNGDKGLDALWRLYSEGRYAEVRKAISDRQTAEAGWQPPGDLIERLEVAEARARLVNASDLKQYGTVVDIAASTPSLLTCSEVDVLWRLAEAFVNTNRTGRGADAYSYILANCANPAERLATVQKASLLLSYAQMQSLLALEKPATNGTREFDAVRDDLARRFIADANADPSIDVAADYIARVETLARDQGKPADALLLGWYQLRHKNEAEAEKWFRAARGKEDSSSASQGLALALIARKAPQEAEDVMYKWRNDSKDATSTYLAATANLMAQQPPPDISEDVLSRIATTVIEQKYVPTAQQLGWYARALNQPKTAAQWFQAALSWKPDDEPSAYGLVLTRALINDRQGVADILKSWAARSSRIANFDKPSASGAAPATPPIDAPQQQTRSTGSQAAQSPSPDNGQQMSQAYQTRMQAAPNVSAPAAQAPDIAAQSSQQRQREQLQYGSAPVPVQPRNARLTVRTTPAPRGGPRPARCATTINVAWLTPQDAVSHGWCLMNLNRPLEAANAFQVGLDSPNSKLREDAAYGQTLAYLRAGLSNDAALAATKAPMSRQRASEVQVAILSERVTAAFNAGRYRESLVYMDQRAQLQQEHVDQMVLRAYAYLKLGMYGDANRVFGAAAATGNDDAIRGLNEVRVAIASRPG